MKRVLWILLVAAAGALAQPTTGDDGSINVPEPSSVVLLGVVAGGVAYATWRNRRKK